MFKRILSAALVFGMAATAPPAMAKAICAPRDHMVAQLGTKFEEQMIGGGLASPTNLIELWTSPSTGTWTVLVTNANGNSCILTSGTNWHKLEFVPNVEEFAG